MISIDQKTTSKNPRSTVGTVTEVYDFLRLLYARAADAYSYLSGKKMVHYTDQQIIDLIVREYAGKTILLLAPLVKGRKGHYKELFDTIRRKGFVRVRVDGEVREITPGMKVDRYKVHTIEVVVDRLKVKGKDEGRPDPLAAVGGADDEPGRRADDDSRSGQRVRRGTERGRRPCAVPEP